MAAILVTHPGVQTYPASYGNSISQAEIANILSQRKFLAEFEATLKDRESAMLSALKAGASVEPGLLRAEIKISERRNVSWKAIVERKLGERYAARVLAATKPDKTEKLDIQ
jgi:hypothetical protein